MEFREGPRKPASRTMMIAGIALGIVVLAVILGVAIGVPLSKRSSSETNIEHAQRVLESVPLVDGHNDWAWQIFINEKNQINNVNFNQDLRVLWPVAPEGPSYIYSQTDIPRLRQGRMGAQFWAAYVSCNIREKDAVRATLEQIDIIKRFVNKYPETFEFVTSAQGIEDAFADNKIGSMIGVEGGHSIDSSLGTLRLMYELGVRYMTITHSCNTPWADNWKVDLETDPDPAESDGLSDFGKKVIMEMNRLGMLVDISHVSVKTMNDVLDTSTAPIIFSHSSALAKCNSKRNVPDDVLLRTKENGGVVMVNFYNNYVTCSDNATAKDVADHIEYIREVAGIETVAIGADYDGVTRMPSDLQDVSSYPVLFAELIERGWSDDDLRKLAGLNLLRAFRGAEQVRDAMRNVDPYEDWIDGALVNHTCRSYGYPQE